MRTPRVGWCFLTAVLLGTAAAGAATDADRCQAAKLTEAGKYGLCRLKAEARGVKLGDPADFSRCDARLGDKWGQAEARYGTECPTNGDKLPVQVFVSQHTDDVAVALAGGPLPDCSGDLVTCTTDLGTCNTDLSSTQSSLATCNGNLTTCGGDLSTCTANYTSCSGSLATCNAGTAGLGDVLSGKTFSSSAGLGVTGTMPNNGAVSITPGTSAQAIAAGYHNGSGTVAGDADLVATNIKKNVNIFGVVGTAVEATLPRTGQTQCDQGDGTLGACPGLPAGQDGALLKGATRSYTDNGDGTITDNVTGLMWEKLSDDGSIHDKDTTYTWYTAFTSKIATLNSGGGFASHTDWRLPNVNELQSLADYGHAMPAIDPAFDTSCAANCIVTTCSCTRSSLYWSSTTTVGNPPTAWGVYFTGGVVNNFTKSTDVFYVRAVRGGS